MENKKLLFIGGHYNSALVELDWLNSNGPDFGYKFKFYWVGKKYVRKGGTSVSPEYLEVSRRDVKFYNFDTGKLYRTTSIKYIYDVIVNLIKIPIGFYRAAILLREIKPDLIISFGGYLAVPIVIIGWAFKVKAITHEQTTVVGLATSIISRFVSNVYTAWPTENYNNISMEKLKQVGLPIRKSILGSGISIPLSCHDFKDNNKPTVYVTGGKMGSQFINEMIEQNLDQILSLFNVIWSCGVGKANVGIINNTKYKGKLLIKEYFDETEIGSVFNTSDIFISRGGAHTIYEIALSKKYAIIIPIPWSSNNEQYKNAKILEDVGLGKILNQEELTSKEFIIALNDVVSKFQEFRKSDVDLSRYGIIDNADEILGKEIIKKISK